MLHAVVPIALLTSKKKLFGPTKWVFRNAAKKLNGIECISKHAERDNDHDDS